MSQIGTDIRRAADLLRQDQVVAIPTETVYGLAGNALSEKAIAQIYTVKNRPRQNPLIVHISSVDEIEKYAHSIPDAARTLVQKFWPGPLTLLLPKTALVPAGITAGSSLVALRVPAHPLTLALLNELPFPLAAPSANPYGYISPTLPAHVQQQLGDRVPYILDGGSCQKGIESTIVGFEDARPVIYRSGLITPEAIEEVLGTKVVQAESKSTVTPGMSLAHYAPRTPMWLGYELADLPAAISLDKIGYLAYSTPHPMVPRAQQIILSPKASLAQSAQQLYEALHRLDAMQLDCILAEWMPHQDIGQAINDRLRRAAHHIKLK